MLQKALKHELKLVLIDKWTNVGFGVFGLFSMLKHRNTQLGAYMLNDNTVLYLQDC